MKQHVIIIYDGLTHKRRERERHIKRKKYIIQHILFWDSNCRELIELGRLSKKGLSCGCWMCRAKTREIGFKISEIRRYQRGLSKGLNRDLNRDLDEYKEEEL